MKEKVELLSNDWITSPSVQLISTMTRTDEDKFYHSHDFFEIFYIVEGSITHNYNGIKERLDVGDIRLLRPNDSHGFIRDTGENCAHRDIIITKSFFEKGCNFLGAQIFSKIDRSATPLRAKLSHSKLLEFENNFSQLFFMPTDKSLYNKDTMSNVLIVELLNAFLKTSTPHLDSSPVWLKELVSAMSSPISMRAGIDYMLSNVSYDKSYICRSFKKHMGCTMSEYLRDRRVEYAATLLLTSDKTVARICEEIGIESIPYFTNSFKKKYLLSPKQFKLKFKPTKTQKA